MLRRAGNLPEKLETDTPKEMQPGEDPNADPNAETPESKTVYKVKNILRDYTKGESTRDAATELLRDIGLDDKKINFHLNEADKIRAEQEKRKQEDAKLKAQNAAQKPGKAPQNRRKKKQEETPVDDEEDARKAQEAKKSLGRE